MLLHRRTLLTGALAAAVPGRARAQAGAPGFAQFLAGIRDQARRQGVPDAILAQALGGLAPSPRVLQLDRFQPEFTQSWAQYRTARLSTARVHNGQSNWAQNQALIDQISLRYGVAAGVILGIWGLESNYGANTGGFNVIQALATLAWDGRRAAFFRGELLTALRILGHGDITPDRMTGSYAGAMGQPQFMPSAYQRFAVDYQGDGRRDIWTSVPDVLASIANYLTRSGWRPAEPWGQAVRLPGGFDPNAAGRANQRSLGDWMALGVRREDGGAFSRADVMGAVLLPGGPAENGAGDDAFMVYANFTVIRRYNPSDFYALAVGLLGDQVVV